MRQKRNQHEEPENHERWLVSYADFITLLFAFFTVMYATSTKDLEKQKQFEDSIKKAFLVVAQFGQGSGPGDYTDPGVDASIIPPPIQIFRRKSASNAELLNAVERVVDENMTKEEQQNIKLELREDSYGVKIAMDSSALFDSGSVSLRPESLRSFDKIAGILKETSRGLIVEGHTDDRPITSNTYPSNWELAATRASTLVRYMIKRHQVDSSKLVAVSYADQRPIASNNTEEGRAKNRRIEILISNRPSGL